MTVRPDQDEYPTNSIKKSHVIRDKNHLKHSTKAYFALFFYMEQQWVMKKG